MYAKKGSFRSVVNIKITLPCLLVLRLVFDKYLIHTINQQQFYEYFRQVLP